MNTLYKITQRRFHKKVVPEKIIDEIQPLDTSYIDKKELELMLTKVRDFKILNERDIDQIKSLNSDDKMRVIMSYNNSMDAIQIMFVDNHTQCR